MAKKKKSTDTASRAKARFKVLKKSGEVKDVKGLIAEGGFEGVKGTGRKGKVKRRDVKAALLADEKKQYLGRVSDNQKKRGQEKAIGIAEENVQQQLKASRAEHATEAANQPKKVAEREVSAKLLDASKRGLENKKVRDAAEVGDIITIIQSDGTKKKVRKGDASTKSQSLEQRGLKVRQMKYGGKVKAVKKAKNGGALKSVPSDAKGLSKLPKSVRNKMGYAKHGSKVKAMYGAKMKKK